MNKIINGYTDKISYYNNDIINVYADCKDNYQNINININNHKGQIIFTIFVNKLNKQNILYEKGIKPIYKDKIVNKPWEDFEFNKSFNFKIYNLNSGIYYIDNVIKFIVKESKI